MSETDTMCCFSLLLVVGGLLILTFLARARPGIAETHGLVEAPQPKHRRSHSWDYEDPGSDSYSTGAKIEYMKDDKSPEDHWRDIHKSTDEFVERASHGFAGIRAHYEGGGVPFRVENDEVYPVQNVASRHTADVLDERGNVLATTRAK